MKDRLCAGFPVRLREVEALLGLPVLATLPEIKSRKHKLKDAGLQVVRKPNSHFAESIRGLESGLELNGDGDTAGRAIIVTSALPGEGKTLTAVSLARQAALSGHRVVIVDADLRRPRVASALGLQKPKNSLTDYLDNRCGLDEALTLRCAQPRCRPHGYASGQSGAMDPLAENGSLDRPTAEHRGSLVNHRFTAAPCRARRAATRHAIGRRGAFFVVHCGEQPPREAAEPMRRGRCAIAAYRYSERSSTRAHPVRYQYYDYGYTGAPSLANYYEN